MKNSLKFGLASLLFLSSAMAQEDAIIIPKKTKVSVRINQYMDNRTVKTSSPFTGSLAEPLIVKGKTIFPEGSYVEGHVDDVRPKGAKKGKENEVDVNLELEPGDLDLVIKMIRNGSTYATISVYPTRVKDTRDPGEGRSLGRTVAGTAIDEVITATTGGQVGKANDPNRGPKNDPPKEPPTARRRATVDPQSVLVFQLAVDAEVRNGEPPLSDSARNSQPIDTDNARANDSTPWRGQWDRFTQEKRNTIRDCFTKNADSIPAAYWKKDTDTASQKVHAGDVLDASVFSRSKAMPTACKATLKGLPESRNVLILDARVFLLNLENRVLDAFELAPAEQMGTPKTGNEKRLLSQAPVIQK